MLGSEVASVKSYRDALKQLLKKARDVKPGGAIEPALTSGDLGGDIESLGKGSGSSFITKPLSHYAAIETACRDIFYDLVGATSADDPAFSEVWNLLDIISLLSDNEQCEPSLIFWLVEELLDTQTIDGCKVIFDYLDSRRERLTAKHFGAKQLIILRACNELLRRLSRAEDTVFCGRVFIFLFQSFPLGDRSSVNLRGEYHIENITTFEQPPASVDPNQDSMQVDTTAGDANTVVAENAPQPKLEDEAKETDIKQAETVSKAVKFDAKPDEKEVAEMDLNTFYPIFWAIQANFSMPTRLFNESIFDEFKRGLSLTLQKFQLVHEEQQARGTTKASDESKRGTKRRHGEGDEEFSPNFNPKYLTSRDLFDLEISDLAFRRHILVQALILIDFLLSLTPKAKKKLDDKTNKSVLYSYNLGDENTRWATQMRSSIAAYLQQGPEGKFYYRMVDTVLSRDKNWVYWKAESCPPIERTSVSAEDFTEAKKGAQSACANKRLKAKPLGSLDLNFLSDAGSGDNLRKLSEPERYTIPQAESFKRPIAEDDFAISMAKTEEERLQAADARASKLWRTLRVASKSKLILFDKIDDGHDLNALFDTTSGEPQGVEERDGINAAGDLEKPIPEISLSATVEGEEGDAMKRNGVEEDADVEPTMELAQSTLSTTAMGPDRDDVLK